MNEPAADGSDTGPSWLAHLRTALIYLLLAVGWTLVFFVNLFISVVFVSRFSTPTSPPPPPGHPVPPPLRLTWFSTHSPSAVCAALAFGLFLTLQSYRAIKLFEVERTLARRQRILRMHIDYNEHLERKIHRLGMHNEEDRRKWGVEPRRISYADYEQSRQLQEQFRAVGAEPSDFRIILNAWDWSPPM